MERSYKTRKSNTPPIGHMTTVIELYSDDMALQSLNTIGTQPYKKLTLIDTLWSSLEFLKPQTRLDSVDLKKQATHLFMIRFRENTTSKLKLKYMQDYYRIIEVKPTSDRQEYLELYCNILGDADLRTTHS